MKNLSLISIIILAITSFILSACSGNTSAFIGEWKLVAYGDAFNPTQALPEVETSINFSEDGQFGGNVGCNSFGASYKVKDKQITFEPIISTLMFCETIADQESVVLEILSDKTLNFFIDGNQIIFTTTDGLSILVLERK